MPWLNPDERSHFDYLMSQLRGAAQKLLDGDYMSSEAHLVAASVEVLEEMFHVEQTPPPPPTSGNGSPSSPTFVAPPLRYLKLTDTPALPPRLFKHLLQATKPVPRPKAFTRRGKRPVKRKHRRNR